MNLSIKISLALIFLFLCSTSYAQINLFDSVSPTTNHSTKISQQNIIKLSPEILNLKSSDQVSIYLPNRSKSLFQITSTKHLANSDYVLTGKSNDGLHFVITVGKDISYGNIFGTNTNYSIGANQNNQQILIDHSENHKLNDEVEKDFLVPPTQKYRGFDHGLAQRKKLIESQQKPGDSKIRVLFLYSNEYAAAVPNTTTRFNQMLAFSNAAFSRSDINIELEFAGSAQIGFGNSKNIGTLLNEVTFSKNQFSNVNQLRNSTYADLVAVIAYNSNPWSTSGIAWVNGDSDKYAFSAMRYPVNGSNAVFTHEIGHNLGSGHEYTSANPSQSSPCEGGYTGYSCGHGAANSWGTIMSYLNRGPVGFIFSDPTKSCLGQPCGIARGRANAADNVTSFNITRFLVANFRGNPPNSTSPNSSNNKFFIAPLLNILLDDD